MSRDKEAFLVNTGERQRLPSGWPARLAAVVAAAAAAATELLLRLHVVLHVGLLDLKLI